MIHSKTDTPPLNCELESYCYNCNQAVCRDCVRDTHSLHHTEDINTVKLSLDNTLREAVREIMQRMETIEKDIARIRSAREEEGEERRRVRREVVTYYEGYLTDLNKHKNELERKISVHHDNCSNMLLKEEVTLGKFYKQTLIFSLYNFAQSNTGETCEVCVAR